jgi:hypothetical protein
MVPGSQVIEAVNVVVYSSRTAVARYTDGYWQIRLLFGQPKHSSGDASRHPNSPAAVARGSGREARPNQRLQRTSATQTAFALRTLLIRGAVGR